LALLKILFVENKLKKKNIQFYLKF